jgi:hypothetical protein
MRMWDEYEGRKKDEMKDGSKGNESTLIISKYDLKISKPCSTSLSGPRPQNNKHQIHMKL